jgi:hypothetical protein
MKWEREPEFTTANRAERCRVGDYELVAFDLPAGRAGRREIGWEVFGSGNGCSRVVTLKPSRMRRRRQRPPSAGSRASVEATHGAPRYRPEMIAENDCAGVLMPQRASDNVLESSKNGLNSEVSSEGWAIALARAIAR